MFIVFFVATVLFGGWLTGQWIAGELDESKLHPGYYLPTVAGGLIAADGAAGFALPVLMVLAQLRLLPVYGRLRFNPGSGRGDQRSRRLLTPPFCIAR